MPYRRTSARSLLREQGNDPLRNGSPPQPAAGKWQWAQELPSQGEIDAKNYIKYQGKILRLNLDGSIPADNPVIGGVRSHIYSYGHRNPQGLVFGPDGKFYASEHGPSSDDEVNLIEAGKNYGWPFVAGFKDDLAYTYANWSASKPEPCASLLGVNINTIRPSVPQQKESVWNHPDFREPLKTFFTVPEATDFARNPGIGTAAISSLDFYREGPPGVPGWSNSLLALGMTRGRVYKLALSPDGRRITGDAVEYFQTPNRYRDVTIGPDGKTFYLATDVQGRTSDASGQFTNVLANPGAILEFTYAGGPKIQ